MALVHPDGHTNTSTTNIKPYQCSPAAIHIGIMATHLRPGCQGHQQHYELQAKTVPAIHLQTEHCVYVPTAAALLNVPHCKTLHHHVQQGTKIAQHEDFKVKQYIHCYVIQDMCDI